MVLQIRSIFFSLSSFVGSVEWLTYLLCRTLYLLLLLLILKGIHCLFRKYLREGYVYTSHSLRLVCDRFEGPAGDDHKIIRVCKSP